MRRFIPFLFCGFAALSYSALAADNDAKASSGTTAGADAKGDANPGVSTSSDNAISEKRDQPEGTAKDSSQSHPKSAKQAKRKNKDEAGAGATTGERKY